MTFWENLINNPWLLAGVVLGVVAVVITTFLLIINKNKISAACQARKARKEAAKAASDAKRSAETSFDSNVFSKREEGPTKISNTVQDANSVIGILNREKKDFKVEQKQKEKKQEQSKQVSEVISILGGNVSDASAYKKADTSTKEVKAEAQAAPSTQESNSVISILNRSTTTNKGKVKSTAPAKKAASKTTDEDDALSGVLGVLGSKKNN